MPNVKEQTNVCVNQDSMGTLTDNQVAKLYWSVELIMTVHQLKNVSTENAWTLVARKRLLVVQILDVEQKIMKLFALVK